MLMPSRACHYSKKSYTTRKKKRTAEIDENDVHIVKRDVRRTVTYNNFRFFERFGSAIDAHCNGYDYQIIVVYWQSTNELKFLYGCRDGHN